MVEILSGIRTTASALTAERTRLDVIAENIANAQTTRGPDGGPYRRRVVVFETVLQNAVGRAGPGETPAAVRVARIQTDPRPLLLVYRPGHPDADANGMVAMPNINVHEEMADLIAASRAYEANLAVVKNARAMAMQTLAIGKR
jgi:flagellar basal-body rod protein FlgC